jgi:hypothetical protein
VVGGEGVLPSGANGRLRPGTAIGGRGLPGSVIGEGALPGTTIGGGAVGHAPGARRAAGVGGVGEAPTRAGTLDGRRAVTAGRGLPSGGPVGEGEVGGRQVPLGGRADRRGRGPDTPGFSSGGLAYQLWETSEGVAPVIAPDTTVVRHDPGPGVLGIDR